MPFRFLCHPYGKQHRSISNSYATAQHIERSFRNTPTSIVFKEEFAMRQAEPPAAQLCSKSSLFLIGKDSRGNWVAQEQRGLCGGLFIDHVEALRFALAENGNRPQAVVMISGVFELDMSRKAATAPRMPSSAGIPRERRIA
jgi:hypothetical protein